MWFDEEELDDEELDDVNGENLQAKYAEKNKVKENLESRKSQNDLKNIKNEIKIKEISDCVKNGNNIIIEMKATMEDLGKIFAKINE